MIITIIIITLFVCMYVRMYVSELNSTPPISVFSRLHEVRAVGRRLLGDARSIHEICSQQAFLDVDQGMCDV